MLGPGLQSGLLYLTLVPSTVQSSIAFTSIAKGNVAGAIVSASASNILGVFLTPLLCWLLMSSTGQVAFTASTIVEIVLQLFVPFVLGQLSRRWTAGFVKAHPQLKLVDRGSIVLVVYAAFSAGMREGMWSQTSWRDLGDPARRLPRAPRRDARPHLVDGPAARLRPRGRDRHPVLRHQEVAGQRPADGRGAVRRPAARACWCCR